MMHESTTYLIIHLFLVVCYYGAYTISGLTGCDRNEIRKYNVSSIIILFIGYIVYIVFSVFRQIDSQVGGIDAYHYKVIFDYTNSFSTFSDFNHYRKEEIGWNLIVWIISRSTHEFKILLFFTHSICYICIAYYFKHLKTLKNSIITFVFMFMITAWLFSAFNTLRFNMALLMSLVVYISIQNGNYKKAFIIFILCLLIHTATIIVVIPLIFCAYKEQIISQDYKKVIILVILSVIIEFVLIGKISSLIYNSAYGSYDNSAGIATGTFVAISITIFLFLLTKKYKYNQRIDDDFILLCCAFICMPIQMQYSIAYRMVTVFMPILYKSLHDLSVCNKISKNNVTLYNAMIIGVTLTYFFYRCYTIYTVDFDCDGLYPYVFEPNIK